MGANYTKYRDINVNNLQSSQSRKYGPSIKPST